MRWASHDQGLALDPRERQRAQRSERVFVRASCANALRAGARRSLRCIASAITRCDILRFSTSSSMPIQGVGVRGRRAEDRNTINGDFSRRWLTPRTMCELCPAGTARGVIPLDRKPPQNSNDRSVCGGPPSNGNTGAPNLTAPCPRPFTSANPSPGVKQVSSVQRYRPRFRSRNRNS